MADTDWKTTFSSIADEAASVAWWIPRTTTNKMVDIKESKRLHQRSLLAEEMLQKFYESSEGKDHLNYWTNENEEAEIRKTNGCGLIRLICPPTRGELLDMIGFFEEAEKRGLGKQPPRVSGCY